MSRTSNSNVGEVTGGDGMGALTMGTITTGDGGSGSSSYVQIDTNNGATTTEGTPTSGGGSGSIGGVSLGDVTITGTGADNIIIGHDTGANAAADLGAIDLQNVTITGKGNLELLSAGDTQNDVNVSTSVLTGVNRWFFSNQTNPGGQGGSVILDASGSDRPRGRDRHVRPHRRPSRQ